MARPRKQQVQQAFEFPRRGGKRPGAGRPPKGPRSSERHKTRPAVNPRHPQHVTTRVVEGFGRLRTKDLFRAIGAASVVVFAREGFRIVHASVQSNHLHVIAEASNAEALARGMQSFLSSAAKRLNRAMSCRTGTRRRGNVFADRYHARALTSPRAVRHCVSYVLNNWRRHGEDRAKFAAGWQIDPYSTGLYFPDWSELGDSPVMYVPPSGYLGLMTWRPRTWLLRVGWLKHGTISNREVPGPDRR